MSTDLQKFKTASEHLLKTKGFMINSDLPFIEPLEEVCPRKANEVAARAFAMSNLTGIGYKANRRTIKKDLKAYNLWDFVTPDERKDLVSLWVSSQTRIHYQWLCECIQGLAWCLGIVELDHFSRCEETLADIIPPYTDPDAFIQKAKLRPIEEIQSQVDLLYRLNWAAKVKERHKGVRNLNYNVIAERRRAIDWVYGVKKKLGRYLFRHLSLLLRPKQIKKTVIFKIERTRY